MRPPDRQPYRSPNSRPGGPPAGRPAPRGRARRPAGPAVIAPAVPTSPGHRRDLIKAAYHRLARLARVPVAELTAADPDRLMAIATAVEPVDGRQGDARRLAAKVIRLRS